MKSGSMVKDALVDLIAKIGEKIFIRRAKFFDDKDGLNFITFILKLKKNW